MVQTSLNEAANNESWGINDFRVLVVPCPAGCVVCNGPWPQQCSVWADLPAVYNPTQALPVIGWQIEKASGNVFASECAGVKLLGGAGIFGTGTQLTHTFE